MPSKALNGGLWEGHTQVVILSQVMIMEVNEWLNGFFHRAHLDQSHFTVLPDKTEVQVTQYRHTQSLSQYMLS